MRKKKEIDGAMSIEAALLLPFVLMLFINLYSVMEIYRIHSSIMGSLWREGRKYAVDASFGDTINENIVQGMWTVGARKTVLKDLDEISIWKQLVKYSQKGIWITSDLTGDILVLQCKYQNQPLFPMGLSFWGEKMATYYGHIWNGYDLSKTCAWETAKQEEYVFITKEGEAYHINRNCSYLNPGIQSVNWEELSMARNKDEKIYYPCQSCGKKKAKTYYITGYGEKYHTDCQCIGLRRTIYTVPLSQVGQRGACKKCSG